MKVVFNPQNISYKASNVASKKGFCTSDLPGFINFSNHNGSSIGQLNDSQLKYIKGLGYTKVIDLANYEKYKQAVEKNGMEYVLCEIEDPQYGIFSHPIFFEEKMFTSGPKIFRSELSCYPPRKEDYKFKEKVDTIGVEQTFREFIDNFVQLINNLQQGNCFISRNYDDMQGFIRVNSLDMLSHCFNPLDFDGRMQPFISNKSWQDVITLYSKFTDKDKRLMGWTREFEEKLVRRLNQNSGVFRQIHL